MKELYIHIGLSKTGSSAIQSWLSLNTKKLQQQGLYYADLSPSAKEGKITAGNGVLLFHACNAENWEEVERLLLSVYFNGNNKAIISSETLQNITPTAIEKIKLIADKNKIETQIIAYARSVYELLYSNYLQGVKRHGFTFRFGEKEGMGYKPQRLFLENYSKVFKSKLRVLNYDSYKNNIYNSFADLLSINAKSFIVKNKKVNRSLTFIESEVLRKMNELHKGIFSTEISDYIISLSPEVYTAVFYDKELLNKTKINASNDLEWINNNLIHDGDFIKLENSEESKIISEAEEATELEVLQEVAKWALSRHSENESKLFVDFLRDFAVFYESTDIEVSYALMKKALILRPRGVFIINKNKHYKSILENNGNAQPSKDGIFNILPKSKLSLNSAKEFFITYCEAHSHIEIFKYIYKHADFNFDDLITAINPDADIYRDASTAVQEFDLILALKYIGRAKYLRFNGPVINDKFDKIKSLAMSNVKLGIGVVTYNRIEDLKRTVEHIQKFTSLPCELVVADDGSKDGTANWCNENGVHVLSGPNKGVVRNKNRALYYLQDIAKCDVVLLIEDDCHPIISGWEKEWVLATILWGHVNFAHQRILNRKDAVISGDGSPISPYLCKLVTGQCTGCSSEALNKVGYLDPRFSGYGFGHVEWTERFIAHDYNGLGTHQKIFPAINHGLKSDDAPTFKDENQLNQNKLLKQSIAGNYSYRLPWVDENEKVEFLSELGKDII